ncbi:MAG TPA: hypothetical protein GXX18_12920 [Bacillales bacterium]|nr:hypothetical protein [Bacillales bacterium]
MAQNNSFEYDSEITGTPDKWQLYIQPNTTANVQWLISKPDNLSFIGDHFVSFSNTGGWTVYGNQQNEPLKAGETYVATAMIRTATKVTSGGGIIKFDLYDGSGNYLGEKVSKTITKSEDWTRVLVVLTYDEAKRINAAASSIKLSIGTLSPTAGTLYFDAVNWLTKPILSIKTKKVEFSPGQKAGITTLAAGVGSTVDEKVSKINTRISSKQSPISNAIHETVGTSIPKQFIKNLGKGGLSGIGVGVAVDWGMNYLRKEEFGAEELKESLINNVTLSLASAGIAGILVGLGAPVLVAAMTVTWLYTLYNNASDKTIYDWFSGGGLY